MKAVNVLAVLSAVIDGDCMDEEVMLMQVLAAVAELIEADKRIDFTPLDDLSDDASCVITVSAGDLRRRAAALARVQGGAA